MRNFLIIVMLLACLTSQIWAQDTENVNPPMLTLNILLKDAIAAPGFSLELLLGNLGIGGTVTGIFVMCSDIGGTGESGTIYIVEPGAYVHFYLGKPEASLYLLGDVSYALFGAIVGDESFNTNDYDSGLLALNGGVGFNAFFGSKKRTHFSIELGVRYMMAIIQGDENNFLEEICTPVVPHFQLQFGMGVI